MSADERGEREAVSADDAAKMRAVFTCLVQDLLDAIDEFGYDAVYFGVGCTVFPEAPCPSDGPDA